MCIYIADYKYCYVSVDIYVYMHNWPRGLDRVWPGHFSIVRVVQ